MSDPLYAQIVSVVDFCVDECKHRREFVLRWKSRGIDFAYQEFMKLRHKNTELLPQLESLIAQAREAKTQPR